MDEKVMFHTSRLRYFLIYLIVIILLVLSFIIFKEDSFKMYSIITSLILIIIAEILTRAIDIKIETDYITNEIGVLSKKTIRIHYFDISDVTIDQSFMQRIFGIGDIHINSSGGSGQKEIVIRKIQDINLVHDIITKKMHKHKRIDSGPIRNRTGTSTT